MDVNKLYTQKDRDIIFSYLVEMCNHLEIFHTIAEPRLRVLIDQINPFELNYKVTKIISASFFKDADIPTEQYEMVDMMLKTCLVLIKFFDPEFDEVKTKRNFLENYPEFIPMEKQDPVEFELLFNFRLYMHISVRIIEPSRNKGILMKIASLLEGAGRIYRSGGGQSLLVTNRELVYEREGNQKKTKRNIYKTAGMNEP